MTDEPRGITIYRANRWYMVAYCIVFVLGGIAMIWSVAWDPAGTGRASRLIASPIWGYAAPVIGVVMILVSLMYGRLVFDPRMLVVDDDGIESPTSYPPQRAEWHNFHDIQGLRLVFEQMANGKRRLIGLPAPLFGIDFHGMLNDIQSRIKRVRARDTSQITVDKL